MKKLELFYNSKSFWVTSAMPTQVKKVRILVASPGDVQSERDQLVKVIN